MTEVASGGPILDGPRLALAPLAEQMAALEAIVRADPDLMALLRLIRHAGLPDAWLVSGAIYQTVWNRLSGCPSRMGIKDYDIVYCDLSDLSWEAEDEVILRLTADVKPLDLPVEIRNQARVHLWFETRFGFPVPPLGSSAESLVRYASTTHAVACRLDAVGRLEILAPFGLRDVFAMHLRPNRLLPNGPSHDSKALRFLRHWPNLTVEWW